MSIRIDSIASYNAFTNLSASSTSLTDSMRRVATGIKMSQDDGAAVGISEYMRAQAKSTAMARNNVENAISAVQTADGWMQKVNDILGRMSELAIESNDITKSSTDRTNIQQEYSQLKSEINRIASSGAKFNGVGLLNGSLSGSTQVGADSGQTISVSLTSLTSLTANLGSVSTAAAAASAITNLKTAITTVNQARAKAGGIQQRLSNTQGGLLTYEDNLRAAEAKVRDVNMAREVTVMMKFQVLTQVGTAMLAQSNASLQSLPQLVG